MNRNILSLLFQMILIMILSPSFLFAEADKIFRENHKAAVVITTYDKKSKPISQGSGFIARSDGVVVTNYHVISNASDIKVKMGSKILHVEGVLYVDKASDIVLLKAKAKSLPFVKLADMDKLKVGDKVYVISSPKGLENTISDGILSGIREIDSERKVLQITAPISAGSSGGAVFNKNGEVIGIATFIIKGSQNLNFALPVNLIKDKLSRQKIIALEDSGVAEDSGKDQYWFYSEDEPKDNDELYLFTLDFIRSLTYINESIFGVLSYKAKDSEDRLPVGIVIDEDKLMEAIKKIEPWSRSRNTKLRRVSENLVIRVKDLLRMNEQIKEEIGKLWLPSTPQEEAMLKWYREMYFSKDEKNGTSGSYYKLMDQIDELSFELFSVITNGVVYMKNNSLYSPNKIDFGLSKRQLRGIYSYLDEYDINKQRHPQENKAKGRANIRFSLFITKTLICNYIKNSPSALDECQLE